MTRDDCIALALAIHGARLRLQSDAGADEDTYQGRHAVAVVQEYIASALAARDSRFDRETFVRVCGRGEQDTSTNKRRSRPYVGVSIRPDFRRYFRSVETPTDKTHGREFAYVVGPFRTVLGAQVFLERQGSTVAQCERLARRFTERSKQSELCPTCHSASPWRCGCVQEEKS